MAETAFRLLEVGDDWRKSLPERPVSENMMRWQKFYHDPCGCAPISHFGSAILMFVCDVSGCFKPLKHTTKIHKTSNMTDFLRVFCLVRKTSVQVDRCVVSLQIVHVLDVPTAGHP